MFVARRLSIALLFVSGGSQLLGCGSAIKTLRLTDGVEALEEDGTSAGVSATEGRLNAELFVEVVALDRVVATGRTGGVAREYRESYPFVKPDYDGYPPEVQVNRETRVKPTGLMMAMEEFSPTVIDLLRRRLEERFKHPGVKLALKHRRPGAIRVEPEIEIRWPAFGTIVGLAKLTASIDTGASIVIKAESDPRYPKYHLGWGLPLTIFTFPIGLIIVLPVIDAIKDDFYVVCVAEALDRAAKELADRLAQPATSDK